MDPKKIALLAGAAVVALGSGFMAMSMFRGNPTPKAAAALIPKADTGPEILVATKPLQIGTIIDPTTFRYQPWPKNLVDNAYYIKGQFDMNKLAGTVVRTTITVGQPITNGALVSPGDRGFLAAALGPGMRAVTFPIAGTNGSSGVAGFVFPGDRVDLVLTQTIAGGPGQPLKTSETIVRNLRVLATDQKITAATDDKGGRIVAPFTNITVEATPRISEKITVAQTLGSLSLSLRSIADSQADLERAIATGDVKLPKGDPAAERRIITEFASHPIDNQVTFVTGGDVSHFQRKSVPLTELPATQAIAPQLHSGGNTPRTARGIEPVRASTGSAAPVVRVARGNSIEEVVVGQPKTPTDNLRDAMGALVGEAMKAQAARQTPNGEVK